MANVINQFNGKDGDVLDNGPVLLGKKEAGEGFKIPAQPEMNDDEGKVLFESKYTWDTKEDKKAKAKLERKLIREMEAKSMIKFLIRAYVDLYHRYSQECAETAAIQLVYDIPSLRESGRVPKVRLLNTQTKKFMKQVFVAVKAEMKRQDALDANEA